MANKISYKLPKPSDLDIFSTQADRNAAVRTQVENIPIDLIDSFPDHPYSVRDDEAMALLVESISENGVLNPPLVRSMDNGRYQMVSGHRRMHACILAGIDAIDCKVLTNIDDDKATILMVDSNFQREQLLPSEKAKAYKMRHEAMKRQGKRTDLEGKESYSAADEIAKTAPDSASTVKRYIRLASLLPAFMEMLDSGELTRLVWSLRCSLLKIRKSFLKESVIIMWFPPSSKRKSSVISMTLTISIPTPQIPFCAPIPSVPMRLPPQAYLFPKHPLPLCRMGQRRIHPPAPGCFPGRNLNASRRKYPRHPRTMRRKLPWSPSMWAADGTRTRSRCPKHLPPWCSPKKPSATW